MFDHVGIRVADRDASEPFYLTVLKTLDIEQTDSIDWIAEWEEFALSPATANKPPAQRLHIAFKAPSRAHVDAFWGAGTKAGYADDGAPGERPPYRPGYYGAFLLDPDGNSVEAVHGAKSGPGIIDHLWIRVADLGATKRFYETIAPYSRAQLGTDTPERVQFRGAGSTFSFVPGTRRTEHVHIHRDNGPPGERPEYHPGYYGAFVFDPDGTNVEVVNHNRV